MLTVPTALVFFATSVLLGLAPGPDNIFVLMQSAIHGKRAGMLVVLGLCTGLVIHTAALALGLAAMFAASPAAFVLLKTMGAIYLAYLAWGAFRATRSTANAAMLPALSARQLYQRGIVMNLTNPKVVFFFLAFLPQFVDSARGAVAMQLTQLGLVFMLSTLLTFGLLSYFAASLGEQLRRSVRAQTWMNRLAGMVFAGLALKLALSQH